MEKAEKKALAIEFLELLDIIYSEFIRLSIETMDFDPKHFIEKRKINLEELRSIREIDQVLAAVWATVPKTSVFGTTCVGRR